MFNDGIKRGSPSPDRFGPSSFIQGYAILILAGIIVYGFSIANIGFVYLNDFYRSLAQMLLISYFIVGAAVTYVSYRFFNSMIMSLSIGWFVVLWTVFSAALCALQVLESYPVVQLIYIIITALLLYCLWLMSTNKVILSTKKKIFNSYVAVWTSIVIFLFVSLWLTGYRRYGEGVGDEGIYHQILGKELANSIAGPFFSIYVSAVVIGLFMWILMKKATKWNFKEIPTPVSIAGHLFYQQGKWGYEGRWGYYAIDSNNFPDAVTFLYDKEGKYYFNRKPIGGSEEKIVLSKGGNAERGIFYCKVVRSEHPSEQIMVVYEEGVGKWHPYEFEEEEEKSSS